MTAKRNQEQSLSNPITLRSDGGATGRQTEEEQWGREEETQESVEARGREWPQGSSTAEERRKTWTEA